MWMSYKILRGKEIIVYRLRLGILTCQLRNFQEGSPCDESGQNNWYMADMRTRVVHGYVYGINKDNGSSTIMERFQFNLVVMEKEMPHWGDSRFG